MSGEQRDDKDLGPVEQDAATAGASEEKSGGEQKPSPEPTPADEKPPETPPAEGKPPDTTPADEKPPETPPAEGKPPDTTPAEEKKPSETQETPDVGATTAPGAVELRFAGITAVGLVREHNEDNLVNANLTTGKLHPRNETCNDTIGERGAIFAVCDGMGGAAAGEVASQMGVDILYDYLRGGEAFSTRDDLARRLVEAVEHAGKRIYDTAQADTSRRGMGTTVTAAVLMDKVLFVAQVGDSRAYLLRRGEMRQVTKDQSLVTQLIEAGHLTEAEAEAFEHSNIILQALGTAESVQVDLTFTELRKRDRLMLCSDGLSGMVDNETIKKALSEHEDPKECCGKLIELANTGGGHDNITVTVVDFDGESLAEPEAEHTFGYVQYPLPPAEDTGLEAASAAETQIEEGDTDEIPVRREQPGPKSSHLWLAAGVLALAAAAVTLAMTGIGKESEEPVPADSHEVQPVDEESEAESTPGEEQPAGAPEPLPQQVPVRVRGDVENALLVINGEVKGELSTTEWQVVDLVPGAYRFEARSDGSTAVEVVATIRPDTPAEIVLALPSGATAPDAKQKAREEKAETPVSGARAPAPRVKKPATMPAATKPAAKPAAKKPAAAPAVKKPSEQTAESKPAESKPAPASAKPSTAETEEKETKPAPAKPASEVLPENPF